MASSEVFVVTNSNQTFVVDALNAALTGQVILDAMAGSSEVELAFTVRRATLETPDA